jgi:hypothetical protein
MSSERKEQARAGASRSGVCGFEPATRTPEGTLPSQRLPPAAASGLTRLNRDMDRLNVLSTYRAIERE